LEVLIRDGFDAIRRVFAGLQEWSKDGYARPPKEFNHYLRRTVSNAFANDEDELDQINLRILAARHGMRMAGGALYRLRATVTIRKSGGTTERPALAT
jgi:hypothetical protein